MRSHRRLLLYALYLYVLHLPFVSKVGTAAPLTREVLGSAGAAVEISRGVWYAPADGFFWEPRIEGGRNATGYSPAELNILRERELRRTLDEDISVRQTFGQSYITIRGRQSEFWLQYENGNMPTEARSAFEYAANKWANIFRSPGPIRVSVKWEPLRRETLGVAESRFFTRSVNHPNLKPGTSYGSAMALALTGQDFVPRREAHIRMRLNSGTSWHYDTSSRAPGNRWDLATVSLHELAHGLFFTGTVNVDVSSREANYRSIPSRFDNFVTATAGGGVESSCRGSRARYSALTEPGLRFINRDTNTNYSLFAPVVYRPGSSTYHLDSRRYRGDCNRIGVPPERCSDLMTPQLQNGYTQRNIGDNTLSILNAMRSNSNGMGIGSCERGLVQPVPPDPNSDSDSPFGAGLSLPRWAIYVLIGVGVLGILTFLVSLATCFRSSRSRAEREERRERRRRERRHQDGPPMLSPPPPAYRRSGEEPI